MRGEPEVPRAAPPQGGGEEGKPMDGMIGGVLGPLLGLLLIALCRKLFPVRASAAGEAADPAALGRKYGRLDRIVWGAVLILGPACIYLWYRAFCLLSRQAGYR